MSHQYEDLPQYGDDETDYAASFCVVEKIQTKSP